LVFSNHVFKEGLDFTLVTGYPSPSSTKLGFFGPHLQERPDFTLVTRFSSLSSKKLGFFKPSLQGRVRGPDTTLIARYPGSVSQSPGLIYALAPVMGEGIYIYVYKHIPERKILLHLLLKKYIL